MGRSGAMRVMIANEPRAYREVIAAAFQRLRPHVEVSVVEPVGSDEALARLSPHFVIWSRADEPPSEHLVAWVSLYPGGRNQAVIRLGQERLWVADVEFDQLLWSLDRADQLRGTC